MDNAIVIRVAQVNPTVGDLDGNLALIRRVRDAAPPNTNLIVFPELVLTGYPPEDLLLRPSFRADCETAMAAIIDESRGRAEALLISSPHWDESGLLYNAAFLIHQGHILATIFKNALPNYGIFDERRYFTPGPLPSPVPFMGINLGIMICEDMWFPAAAAHLRINGADILICPNASPYQLDKPEARLQQAEARVAESRLPLIYVNQLGGQDELVFDGGSFMLNETGRLIMRCHAFREDFQDLTLAGCADGHWIIATERVSPPLDDVAALYAASVLATRDYLKKTGTDRVILGLSGGVDSALVAAIAADAVGVENLRCVALPSPYTSEASIEDARDCAQRLSASFEIIGIDGMMDSFDATLPGIAGVAHENMQSRLRGLILMALSNQTGAMVLTTGNKSEIACGYSTLYGDMCGGFNPIKDLYKTQVYALCAWRNRDKPADARGPDGEVINQSIRTKAPSAELRPGQTDQDSLPPYDQLDAILALLIEHDQHADDIIALGYDKHHVRTAARLLDIAEYKRRQSAPGPKLSRRAFGRDRRYPIANGYAGHRLALKNGDKPVKD